MKFLYSIFILALFFSCDSTSKLSKSNEDVEDYYDVPEKYYHLNNIGNNSDSKVVNFQSAYYTQFKKITDGQDSINKISIFLPRIEKTIIGNNIRDSILLYLDRSFNKEVISIFEEYNNENQNTSTVSTNEYIIKRKKTYDQYSYSNFSFSILTYRTPLSNQVSLLLPNTDWKKTEYGNFINYLAGDNYYSGRVSVSNSKISRAYDIYSDDSISYTRINLKEMPKNKDDKNVLYTIKPGKIKLIGENVVIGNKKILKIYEQITCSSDQFNFQLYVARRRFYLTEDEKFEIELESIIAGNHVLADRNNLILQKGLLLDTVVIK